MSGKTWLLELILLFATFACIVLGVVVFFSGYETDLKRKKRGWFPRVFFGSAFIIAADFIACYIDYVLKRGTSLAQWLYGSVSLLIFGAGCVMLLFEFNKKQTTKKNASIRVTVINAILLFLGVTLIISEKSIF